MRFPILLLSSVLSGPATVMAQQLPPRVLPAAVDLPIAAPLQASRPLVPNTPNDPLRMALGGVLAGAGGALAGGAIGARLTDTCEDCALEGLAYGLVAGWSTAAPLGVHLANGRKGNYGEALFASLAVGAAGFGATLATGEGAIMIAVPVMQLVSSIAIEGATSR
jgi:hypothetical protein